MWLQKHKNIKLKASMNQDKQKINAIVLFILLVLKVYFYPSQQAFDLLDCKKNDYMGEIPHL
jgi:hypothetical protein